MTVPGHPTRVEVDLGAVAANVEAIVDHVAPTPVSVVVKADGYGHGAVPVGRTALAHGAASLAVAHPVEAADLRAAGIDAPILVLSEPRPDAMADLVTADVHFAAYTEAGIDAASVAAQAVGGRARVHLKVDTGMHRVGARPDDVVALARRATQARGVSLQGVWTHCAVADDPADPFTAEQVRRMDEVLLDLEAAGIDPVLVHQANSAAALAHPATHRGLVRVGIAAYGVPPSAALAPLSREIGLRPAMRLVSEVTLVHEVEADEGVSYGRRHMFDEPALLATVPIGYADGVARALGFTEGVVLIGGRRRPIRGVVTMDQLVVEVTGDPVAVGDEVLLLGGQGDDEITALEWAEHLGTIGYEVVTRIGPRVPRTYLHPQNGRN
jgi:alanine racemase